MKFDDDDLHYLKQCVRKNKSKTGKIVYFSVLVDEIEALLARLDAAERLIAAVGKDIHPRCWKELEAWRKAKGL